MKNYNSIEKKVAQLLKFNPILHSKIKLIYQKFSYLLNKDKGFKIQLHENCNMIDLNVKNSFFGYYDHIPWSENMMYFILHNYDGGLHLNLYQFINNKIIFKKKITTTSYFNLQQGIRPVWLNNNQIIFNRVLNNNLISSIYDIKNDSFKDFDFPIQEISSKYKIIFSIDYSKFDFLNKDYGYRLHSKISHKKIDGITGYDYMHDKIIFKLQQKKIHKISKNNHIPLEKCELNHLHHSPYENSFVFIYRTKYYKGFSELYEYNYRKDSLIKLYSGSMISHYCWINKNLILAYLKHQSESGFFEINYRNKEEIHISKNILDKTQDNTGDGHPSVSPDNKWVIYDSYPNKARHSHLYLIQNNIKNNSEKILVGKFLSPLKFNGYNRCDLHPRWSPDSRFISIDSCHEGIRKSYLIDISKII